MRVLDSLVQPCPQIFTHKLGIKYLSGLMQQGSATQWITLGKESGGHQRGFHGTGTPKPWQGFLLVDNCLASTWPQLHISLDKGCSQEF